MFFNRSNKELIEGLKDRKVLSSGEIEKAFLYIDRKEFILPEYSNFTYNDQAIPIGYGQTISQPYTVAFILKLLQAQKGEKILDIGSGSGWTTALLSQIVGKGGFVYGVEIIPELVEFGQKNISKFQIKNANIQLTDKKQLGLPKEAPFDKILVSASAEEFPERLLSQIKVGGVIVIPILNSIFRITKISTTEIKKEEFPGFVFVPLELD